jgi:two-component system phosphate regulon sensor histidine kinase PhoR
VTVVALLGLIVLQGFLLQSAYELKEQSFAQNVLSAMVSASIRLEAGETVLRAFQAEGGEGLDSLGRTATAVWTRRDAAGGSKDTTLHVGKSGTRVRAVGSGFAYHVGTPQRVRVMVTDGQGRDSVLIDTLQAAGDHTLAFDGARREGSLFYRFDVDSTSMVVHVQDGNPGPVLAKPATEAERTVLVSRVIDNLWVSENTPIEERVKPAVLDSILKRSMAEAGIPLEFSYGLIASRRDTAGSDTVRMAVPPGAADRLRATPFRVPLSPAGLFGPSYSLAVDVPGRGLFLLRQIGPALLSVVFFLALIVLAFVVTVRTIASQERLMTHMTEFINNMTHEFKTPLSTVALATEAIRRPDIVGRQEKVLQYASMIGEEAARMKSQVDRILELAELEEGEVELVMQEVDLHGLIRSVAGGFTLQVESRGGRLDLGLDARDSRVRGDAVHLRNILQSLLDNANKYSSGAPAIRVHTAVRGAALAVEVIDQGIGIPQADQKRVFEKYYRVPTGNLHDVKGFGLGLSYVRLIARAHGGDATLESEEGAGTRVTVTIPLAPPTAGGWNA